MNPSARKIRYTKGEIYLITGGAGFIGSHIAKSLHTLGAYVRIADVASAPWTDPEAEHCSQYLCGNLCDPIFCTAVMQNVHTVIHLAATMGGMGVIHDANDFIIHRENRTITSNVLEVAIKAGARRFLYASSACVYPTHLQSTADGVVRLRETDLWNNSPPSPQGLYGLEKLEGEILLNQFLGEIDVKIARFHNVYGPGGTWYGGREKAPAALARKAVALKLGDNVPLHFEMWGDGSQRRSFLYIDDAVEAVIRLLDSDGPKTVNIGSEQDVTLKELAHIALFSTGISTKEVIFDCDSSKPIGVASRNSNNDLVSRDLEWTPTVALEEGMRHTTKWIEAQIKKQLVHLDETRRSNFIVSLQKSEVVHLDRKTTFGILLPITSRGSNSPRDCLDNLKVFSKSLERTTWRDTHMLGATQFHVKVYLAIDHDDEFLLQGEKPEAILRSFGIIDVTRLVCTYPRGQVCHLWRHCADRAWRDGCVYMTLLGDDVELLDEGWLRDIHQAFHDLADKNQGPLGLGCVALTDVSFPGMPTFPVLHRIHMDIFGEVIPECFVNQDGDPYLFQLYRRFGSSLMIPLRIRNSVGGSAAARYNKVHAVDWTYQPLADATATAAEWLKKYGYQVERKLILDVVIPSYRVQMRFLEPILELARSDSCSVMWIIIIDNPNSPTISELQQKYGDRTDVRIRVNPTNLGASASRNRGIAESAAEWVHFLDDDVTPHPDLLFKAEEVIRTHPAAAGFVGNAQFPTADSIFKTAVHLSGVTYFWDIATKIQADVPWGVTANLLVRRDVQDGILFDLRFPKTGGGEDIDFCIRKRDRFMNEKMEGFRAAPEVIVTHPWWNDGRRSYWRFYMWAKGDGALVSIYPQHCFVDPLPNSAELILYSSFGILGIFASTRLAVLGTFSVVAVIIARVVHDSYHHLVLNNFRDPRSTLSGIRWVLAVLESGLIQIVSEAGRLFGQIERGEFVLFQQRQRFDWFVRVGPSPAENERRNRRQCFMLWASIMVVAACFVFDRF